MAEVNVIQQKVDALVAEDKALEQGMLSLQQQFEEMRTRRIEIAGSIRTLVEMFAPPATEEGSDDTESEIEPGSDSDEG